MFKWKEGVCEASSDVQYGVLDYSLLNPYDVLEDPKQAQEVADAIALVNTYIAYAQADGVLEEI